MTHVALEVAEYLEDNGIGTVGTDIFVDMLPDLANDAIMVYSTGGQVPDIDLPIGSPNFEVLVRSDSAATAHTKITSIVDLLHQQYNTVLVTDGNHYYSILLLGEINALGRDEKGRIEYSVNFNCKVRGR